MARRVYDECVHGLKIGSVDATHGALLCAAELCAADGPLLEARFRRRLNHMRWWVPRGRNAGCDTFQIWQVEQLGALFERAWATRDHREKSVRRAFAAILPTLAAHCGRSPALASAFESTHLGPSLDHLTAMLRSSSNVELRGAAFAAFGAVALAVSARDAVRERLPAFFKEVREAAAPKGRSRKPAAHAADAVACVAVLAQARTSHSATISRRAERSRRVSHNSGARRRDRRGYCGADARALLRRALARAARRDLGDLGACAERCGPGSRIASRTMPCPRIRGGEGAECLSRGVRSCTRARSMR